MKSRLHATAKRHKGFGLVEVMVAMIIGMLGIIIMMQVFAVAEGQKRSTTGAGDAQNNGAMALYTLQRDVRQAGYGFNALKVLGCPLTLPAPASRTLTYLAPAVINPPVAEVPAGDANTDTLLIAYGSSEGSPEGDAITMVAGSQLGVMTSTNFRKDHWVIAAPSEATVSCALTLAKVTAVAAPNVQVDASGAVEGGFLFNLGAAPRILAYAVRAGNLTVCDYMARDCSKATSYTDTAIASNIVSLRAQYGHASTATSGVDSWNKTTADTACGWARTTALRIAVVARNSQVEKDEVSGPKSPAWEGSPSPPDPPAPPSDPSELYLTATINWKNYRYTVFQTAIPIRNLPWMESCPP